MSKNNQSLNRSTAIGSIAKFASALGSFIGRTLFARIIGPLEFGGFFFIYSIVQIIDWPLSGWSSATKKRLSERKSPKNEIFSSQVIINVFWLIISTFPVFLFQEEFRLITGIQSAPLLYILLMIHVSIINPLFSILFAEEKVGLAMWLDTLRAYLTLIFQGLFVYYGFAAIGMAYGTIVGTVLVSTIIIFNIDYILTLPSRKTINNIWEYGKFSSITQLLGKGYDRLDMILIGFFVSPTAVGYYEAANILTLPSMFVSETASSGLLPFISKRSETTKRITSQVTQSLVFSSLFSIPIFFGSLIISQPLITTAFGGEYLPAAELLIIIALYKLLKSQSHPLTQVIDGFDRPDINVRISLLTVILNVILGVALVIRIGVIGVAIATVISELARYLLVRRIAKSFLSDMSIITHQHLIQIGAGGFMASVVWFLEGILHFRSWSDIGIVLIAGVTSYFMIILLLDEEIRQIVQQEF